jgi:hypothetical protein
MDTHNDPVSEAATAAAAASHRSYAGTEPEICAAAKLNFQIITANVHTK